MLILLILGILIFVLGGGYYDTTYREGNWARGGGVGLGTILLILLIAYLLMGGFPRL